MGMKDIEIVTAFLKDGSHLAFARSKQLQLEQAISDCVHRGIESIHLNVFFVTRSEFEKYVPYLKKSGIEVDKLFAAGEIVLKPIDQLLLEKRTNHVAESVARELQTLGEVAKSKEMKGLNIVDMICGNLAEQGRYDDALFIELFWEDAIHKSIVPITLMCPYESIPRDLADGLEELRNCPLFIDEIWEVVPANFNCAKCGRKVEREIRIHEPGMMVNLSRSVSSVMKGNDAGWIPFCFDCILTHPLLKPPWLNAPNINQVGSDNLKDSTPAGIM